MKFHFLSVNQIARLPKTAGVYQFQGKNRDILYIGKAANLKERVRNHFQQPSFKGNFFIEQTKKIGYLPTDSEIEALVLESRLIKSHLPKYNVIWKDDKNYFYVAITKEKLPRIFLTHQTKIQGSGLQHSFIGPFVDGAALKHTLRYLRKIFPYYAAKKHPRSLCPWCHLNLCPGPNPDQKSYRKNIRSLISILQGKKKNSLNNLAKEMIQLSKAEDFEEAAKTRDKIRSLENIIAHAHILTANGLSYEESWQKIQRDLRNILKTTLDISRIEAFDISNIQGQEATGSMAVFIKGQPAKNHYRKFKIRISGKPNDTAMVKEVLSRRFEHSEWPMPELILIDGGIGQLNAAIQIKMLRFKNQSRKNLKITSLAKKHNKLFIEGRQNPVLLKTLPQEIFNLIIRLRDEAHRFALMYHHKLREKRLASSL